jgi:hypothetical protein
MVVVVVEGFGGGELFRGGLQQEELSVNCV